MFGLSFGEVVLLVIIAIVVVGPRNLPQMMRSLGRTVSKIRRMTTDLREQSGIDEILRAEGIEREVNELRKLATGRILEVNLDDDGMPRLPGVPPRSREYPASGVDSYGALPDDAAPYEPPRAGDAAASAAPASAAPAPAEGERQPPKLSAPEGEREARGRPTAPDPFADHGHDGALVDDAPAASAVASDAVPGAPGAPGATASPEAAR